MESLQQAGWEPSPPSKGVMSSAVTETWTQPGVPVTAQGREGHLQPQVGSFWRLHRAVGSLSCWGCLPSPAFPSNPQFLPCSPASLESHSLSWCLCFPGWFGTWQSLALFCQTFSLPSFSGAAACRDLEFLSYSALENSGWFYPHNKAALKLHTSSTHDRGSCPLRTDKLCNFSLFFRS